MSFLCGFRKDERQQVCRRVRFSVSNSYGAYTDAGCFGKFWPKNVRHFFRTIWPQAMLQNENIITAFTFVASLLYGFEFSDSKLIKHKGSKSLFQPQRNFCELQVVIEPCHVRFAYGSLALV